MVDAIVLLKIGRFCDKSYFLELSEVIFEYFRENSSDDIKNIFE